MNKNKNIAFGMSKQLGLGFNINRYLLTIDFLCFWFSVEF